MTEESFMFPDYKTVFEKDFPVKEKSSSNIIPVILF